MNVEKIQLWTKKVFYASSENFELHCEIPNRVAQGDIYS